jgi:hypothetical protein
MRMPLKKGKRLMDNLEQRLRDDAALIRVDVPPHVQARLQASLRAARAAPPARREFSLPLWLAASLTGAAASVVAIVAVNWGNVGDYGGDHEAGPADATAYSVPEYVSEFERQLPLRAKTADLTEPLEEELENLRSDLERARKNVEQDLDFTF